MSHNLYEMVEGMHGVFDLLEGTGQPRFLSPEEQAFRITGMREEITEYEDATAGANFAATEDKLEEQLDALVDLVTFALTAAQRQGFSDFNTAFERVTLANCQKELAGTDENSRRGFRRDMIKPEGWRAPYLRDLVLRKDKRPKSRGIILLEGPDHCGKTHLAKYLEKEHQAHIMHSTWTPTLDARMSKYICDTIETAIMLSDHMLVVLDRSWLSHFVYQEVYRNQAHAENWYTLALHMLRFNKALTVVCLPSDTQRAVAEFESAASRREEMYSDRMDVIHWAYKTLWYGENNHLELGDEGAYPFNRRHLSHLACSKLSGFERYDYLAAKDGDTWKTVANDFAATAHLMYKDREDIDEDWS